MITPEMEVRLENMLDGRTRPLVIYTWRRGMGELEWKTAKAAQAWYEYFPPLKHAAVSGATGWFVVVYEDDVPCLPALEAYGLVPRRVDHPRAVIWELVLKDKTQRESTSPPVFPPVPGRSPTGGKGGRV